MKILLIMNSILLPFLVTSTYQVNFSNNSSRIPNNILYNSVNDVFFNEVNLFIHWR